MDRSVEFTVADALHQKLFNEVQGTCQLKNRIIALWLVLAMAFTSAFPDSGYAQGRRGISLIRDAEIEALMWEYSIPLFKAAGLRPGAIEIMIVGDQQFNAFVAGRRVFINTGAILDSKTPNELIGVIAHEIGHLAGGHQQRLADQLARAKIVSGIATLLGVGVLAAGAASGNRQVAGAGGGIVAGGSRLAIRGLLRYQRGEESAADRAALKYLAKTGQSARGLLTTFSGFAENLNLQGGRVNPYMQSHPLPRDRIASLKKAVKNSKYYNRKDKPSLQERHDLARAKIAAYLGGRRNLASLIRQKGLSPLARQYGEAIGLYLYGSPKNAIPKINALIRKRPNNAYFHEMKGEIMLRSGKPAAAISPFRKAVKLDRGRSGFLRVELGQALLSSGRKTNIKPAIAELRKGLARDPSLIIGHRYLARAYQKAGNTPLALLSSAEEMFWSGKIANAKNFANRAQQKLKRGSPGWLRAQDIISYKK